MAEAFAVEVGKRVAVDAAQALTDLVTARAVEALHFKRQLEKLRKKFLTIQALLQDAASEKHDEKSQLVRMWLEKVKDVAYSADDVMDEYAFEILRRKIEVVHKFTDKLRDFFSLANNPVAFRVRMSGTVGDILKLFDELDVEAKSIGLRQVDIAKSSGGNVVNSVNGNSSNARLNQAREHAAADASEIVGRRVDEKKLVEMICSSSHESRGLSTLAIVGMGGLGKTTLLRHIYENKKMDEQFADKKFWICVSESFDIKRVLNEMVESLTSTKCDLSNTDAIIRKLQAHLKGHKFLLVLDDVWSNDNEIWESLKLSLQRTGALSGSTVLLTTRSIQVARRAKAAYIHSLSGLSDEESWTLFVQTVTACDTISDISCMQGVGKRIVKKCKGVPLAIKVIGSLLQSKQHLYEWESIEKSEIWDLSQDENNIMPSLLLSYNSLPSPSLKQCFAYCAIFPKDSLMEKGDLIAVWMSQGFLGQSETSNQTMEEIGEEYLNVLLNNSFLQEEKEKGEMSCFSMHDLVHDLALYVSQSDLVVWKSGESQNNGFDCRHLVFNPGKNEIALEIPVKNSVKKLRTVTLLGRVPNDMLIQAKCLRTLRIDGLGITEVPSVIALLKHLRYLDLSNNPISSLPDFVTKLYQLQALRIKGCKLLRELPEGLRKLVNLRHIMASHSVVASRGLHQLECLQTLPMIQLRDREGWTIDELGPLDEVKGNVHISGLEHVKSKEEAREAGLRKKAKVLTLQLDWTEGRAVSSVDTDEDVLEGLEPCATITSLVLSNYGGVKFPKWMTRMAVVTPRQGGTTTLLRNLRTVKLVDCSRCQQLPMLGQLPFLKSLFLRKFDVESITYDFYGVQDYQSNNRSTANNFPSRTAAIFPALEELTICEFHRLTTWMQPPPELASAAFPYLGILKVRDCPELESIPALEFRALSCLKIQDLGSIQSLDIIKHDRSNLISLNLCGMSEMTSLPDELSNCKNLQTLEISSCQKLTNLPKGLKRLSCLKTFRLKDCSSLKCLPDDIFLGLSSLRELSLTKCEWLRSIPDNLQACRSLEEIKICNCTYIGSPLPDFSLLSSLVELEIFNSGSLTTPYVLDKVRDLPQLRGLSIGGCGTTDESQPTRKPKSNHNKALTTLVLKDHQSIDWLPYKIQLATIKSLTIWDVEDLQRVPECISEMLSLEVLCLRSCKKLEYVPPRSILVRLTRLWALLINECPLLTERCARDTGPDWHHIAHIPFVQFNGDVGLLQ